MHCNKLTTLRAHPRRPRCLSNFSRLPRVPAVRAGRLSVPVASTMLSNIRLGGPEDASSISDNNVAMAKESENTELPPDVCLKGVTALLTDATKGQYFVIQGPDGDVVAQLMITYEWSDWRNAQVWWIQSVYVKPEHRRQGLFQSLYKHVKEASAKDGACGLRLYADFDNSKANSTYEAMGMVSHYKVYEDLNTDY